ncbi:hypothetical protein PanNE5_23390 [Pandoraea sp. NE5]|nr:hypothetical protein PanNE5_23390 [Pandoraea sp. NE5]
MGFSGELTGGVPVINEIEETFEGLPVRDETPDHTSVSPTAGPSGGLGLVLQSLPQKLPHSLVDAQHDRP